MSTLRLVITGDGVKIFRKTAFAALMYAAVAVTGVLLGLFLSYGIQGSGVPAIVRYAGCLTAGGCASMPLFLPRHLNRLNRQGGDLIFEADREGIKAVPDRLMGAAIWGDPLSTDRLGWGKVRDMVCTEWFEQKLV